VFAAVRGNLVAGIQTILIEASSIEPKSLSERRLTGHGGLLITRSIA